MDPSTALSVASLAYEITKDLYDYYRAWKHCDDDVKTLRVHLLWLHNAFRVLRDVVCKPDLSGHAGDLVYQALAGCNKSANDLSNILDKIRNEGSPQHGLDKLKTSARRLYYPFKRRTVAEIFETVESCRDEIHLAVSVLQLDTTTRTIDRLRKLDAKLVDSLETMRSGLMHLPAIAVGISEVQDQNDAIKVDTEAIIDSMRLAEKRQAMSAILDWLCPTDYSQQLNDFHARKQNGTGVWFLQVKPFQCVECSPPRQRGLCAVAVETETFHSSLCSRYMLTLLFFNPGMSNRWVGGFPALTRRLVCRRSRG